MLLWCSLDCLIHDQRFTLIMSKWNNNNTNKKFTSFNSETKITLCPAVVPSKHSSAYCVWAEYCLYCVLDVIATQNYFCPTAYYV